MYLGAKWYLCICPVSEEKAYAVVFPPRKMQQRTKTNLGSKQCKPLHSANNPLGQFTLAE